MSHTRIPILLTVCFTLAGTASRAQGISAVDSVEAARFATVLRETARAGYANPVVVARGANELNALFAVLATRAHKGVLLVLLSAGGGAASLAEVESGNTPADIGVRGVSFSPFLGVPDLLDAIVTHEPFMLESSRRFDTHHLLRCSGKMLTACCEFEGAAHSSSSKGMRSSGSTRSVTFEKLPSEKNLLVRVHTVDEETEQADRSAVPKTVSRNETVKDYEMPASGPCRAR